MRVVECAFIMVQCLMFSVSSRVGLQWSKTDSLIGSLVSVPWRRARQFFADHPRRRCNLFALRVHLSTHVVRTTATSGLKFAIAVLFHIGS